MQSAKMSAISWTVIFWLSFVIGGSYQLPRPVAVPPYQPAAPPVAAPITPYVPATPPNNTAPYGQAKPYGSAYSSDQPYVEKELYILHVEVKDVLDNTINVYSVETPLSLTIGDMLNQVEPPLDQYAQSGYQIIVSHHGKEVKDYSLTVGQVSTMPEKQTGIGWYRIYVIPINTVIQMNNNNNAPVVAPTVVKEDKVTIDRRNSIRNTNIDSDFYFVDSSDFSSSFGSYSDSFGSYDYSDDSFSESFSDDSFSASFSDESFSGSFSDSSFSGSFSDSSFSGSFSDSSFSGSFSDYSLSSDSFSDSSFSISSESSDSE